MDSHDERAPPVEVRNLTKRVFSKYIMTELSVGA